jgi:hypothetical protein
VRAAGLLSFCALVSGCAREADEALCPDLVEGDLVITEIVGPQTGNATPSWIEVYNASGAPVDLYGLRVRFRRLDGKSETSVLVRRSLEVAPGSYTVLGRTDDDTRAAHIDYGFVDFQASWLASAAVDVESCGVRIDRVIYNSLTRAGSYALGVNPPTADANDLPANWCIDATVDASGVPGSPQQANPACP